jgi:hypothetical protein
MNAFSKLAARKWMLLTAFFCVLTTACKAGMAVAIVYDGGGVTTFPIACPSAAQIVDALECSRRAVNDARQTGNAHAQLLFSSDLTGYFCVAMGQQGKRALAHVGYGATPAQARQDAITGLNAIGATSNQRILHELFSYGAKASTSRSAE